MAKVKANAIEITLTFFSLKEKRSSDKVKIVNAIASVSVWTYLGQATNNGDSDKIIPKRIKNFGRKGRFKCSILKN